MTLAWICMVLSLGMLRLVYYWRPDWMLKSCCVTESLNRAEYVLIEVTVYSLMHWYCSFVTITKISPPLCLLTTKLTLTPQWCKVFAMAFLGAVFPRDVKQVSINRCSNLKPMIDLASR